VPNLHALGTRERDQRRRGGKNSASGPNCFSAATSRCSRPRSDAPPTSAARSRFRRSSTLARSPIRPRRRRSHCVVGKHRARCRK
jgi:hypothetical protein